MCTGSVEATIHNLLSHEFSLQNFNTEYSSLAIVKVRIKKGKSKGKVVPVPK
jgi:hypothetical protein